MLLGSVEIGKEKSGDGESDVKGSVLGGGRWKRGRGIVMEEPVDEILEEGVYGLNSGRM